MDPLTAILKAVLGDQPANGWTAFITLVICAAYVVAQLIRAKHHRDMASQGGAALVEGSPPVKPPSSAGLTVLLLFLFGLSSLARITNVAALNQADLRARPAPPAADDKDCDPLTCKSPCSCSRGKCKCPVNAQPTSVFPGADSSILRASWQDTMPDPGDRWQAVSR